MKPVAVTILLFVLLGVAACGSRADPERGSVAFRGETLEQWIEVLRSGDPDACFDAVDAISDLAIENEAAAAAPAVPALAHVLRRSEDPATRHNAALALEFIELHALAATSALIEAVRSDPDQDVRRRSLEALSRVASPYGILGREGKRQELPAGLNQAGLEAASAKALPAVLEALGDKSFEVRVGAVGALGAWGPEARGLAPRIASLAAHEDDGMRYVALQTLRDIHARPDDALEPILRGLRQPGTGKPPHAVTQRVAIMAIGEMGAGALRALPALRRHAQDPDLRSCALKAIQRVESSGGGK